MQITCFETVRKMPKRQPRSRNEQDHHHNPNQRQFDPSMDRDGASGGGGGGAGNAGSYGGVEDNRNNPLAGKDPNRYDLIQSKNYEIERHTYIFTLHHITNVARKTGNNSAFILP